MRVSHIRLRGRNQNSLENVLCTLGVEFRHKLDGLLGRVFVPYFYALGAIGADVNSRGLRVKEVRTHVLDDLVSLDASNKLGGGSSKGVRSAK